jgi:hypothetical protein
VQLDRLADIPNIYRERVIPFCVCLDAYPKFLLIAESLLLPKRNVLGCDFSVKSLVVIILHKRPFERPLSVALQSLLQLCEKWNGLNYDGKLP